MRILSQPPPAATPTPFTEFPEAYEPTGDFAYDSAMAPAWPELIGIRRRLAAIESEAEQSDTGATADLLAERHRLLARREALHAGVAAAEAAARSPEQAAAVAAARAERLAEMDAERAALAAECDGVRMEAGAHFHRVLVAALEVLADVARGRGVDAVPSLERDDDGQVVTVDDRQPLLGPKTPPDLAAVFYLVADELRDGFDAFAQAEAARFATHAGVSVRKLRQHASALASFLIPAVRSWGVTPIPADVRQLAAQRAWLVPNTEAKPAAETKAAGKLRFQTESEWSAKLEWHFDGLLPVHGLGLVFAEPGCGKSLLAKLMAACTATSSPFAGRPTRGGRVVYCCADSPASTKRRLAALPPEARRRIVAVPELRLPDDAEELASWLQNECAHGDPPRLLIVDTWDSVRLMPGAGYTQEDKSILECTSLLRLIADRLRIGVVLIHHSTKNLEAPTARGSAALRGRLEWEARLHRVGDGLVELVSTKCRDSEMGVVGTFKIVTDPHPADGQPTPRLEYLTGGFAAVAAKASAKAACRDRLDGERRRVLVAMLEAPDHNRTKASLAAAVGMSPTSLYRHIKQMRDDGLVTSTNFYLTPGGTAAAEAAQRADGGGQ